jgi:hypothetical protein
MAGELKQEDQLYQYVENPELTASSIPVKYSLLAATARALNGPVAPLDLVASGNLSSEESAYSAWGQLYSSVAHRRENEIFAGLGRRGNRATVCFRSPWRRYVNTAPFGMCAPEQPLTLMSFTIRMLCTCFGAEPLSTCSQTVSWSSNELGKKQ